MTPHSLTFGSYDIDRIWLYLLLVILLDFGVRIITVFLRTIDNDEPFKNFKVRYGSFFKGTKSDRWLTFILGFFELFTYPILISTENWPILGAWLGFKTVSQWRRWKKNRNSFIRFLLGNIMVVIFSYLFLSQFILLKLTSCH